MALLITSDTLKNLNMTSQDLLIEMATHFYDIGKMSMGQARRFAGINQITFQKELARRNINIKYDVDDLKDDLKAIESYQNKSW